MCATEPTTPCSPVTAPEGTPAGEEAQLLKQDADCAPPRNGNVGVYSAEVIRIGVEPRLLVHGMGEYRFAYRNVQKRPREPRPYLNVGDRVECRLTGTTPPKAVSVRLVARASASFTHDPYSLSPVRYEGAAAAPQPEFRNAGLLRETQEVVAPGPMRKRAGSTGRQDVAKAAREHEDDLVGEGLPLRRAFSAILTCAPADKPNHAPLRHYASMISTQSLEDEGQSNAVTAEVMTLGDHQGASCSALEMTQTVDVAEESDRSSRQSSVHQTSMGSWVDDEDEELAMCLGNSLPASEVLPTPPRALSSASLHTSRSEVHSVGYSNPNSPEAGAQHCSPTRRGRKGRRGTQQQQQQQQQVQQVQQHHMPCYLPPAAPLPHYSGLATAQMVYQPQYSNGAPAAVGRVIASEPAQFDWSAAPAHAMYGRSSYQYPQ
eukprot:TRINITY_DN1543_c0_g1_i1.p2 TRINITY_DN1543_c0_g1~~TRINITY_DN1543_c0_g1_i1.p2  ORF type:complete len:432 (+),score=128.63 TRINITY_DN1543_c0_g1_i1:40-1335(+)